MRTVRTILTAMGTALLMTAAPQGASAASRHHHHYSSHAEARRNGFGRYDPDNIGIYGGRDFGFFEGPNGETTYDYR